MIVYASLDARAAAISSVSEPGLKAVLEGLAPLYPEGDDARDADKRISAAIRSMGLRKRLADAGLKVAAGCRWDKAAGVYLQVWGIGLTAVEARRALLRAS
jgi:hypothetical protein